MNLTEELQEIAVGPTRAKTVVQDLSYVLWRLFGVVQDMAKRIEALERHKHSHPLGVGSYAVSCVPVVAAADMVKKELGE